MIECAIDWASATHTGVKPMALSVPELPHHCNSWIVVDEGVPVMETWDRAFVERLAANATAGVEIYTAAAWLVQFNCNARAKA